MVVFILGCSTFGVRGLISRRLGAAPLGATLELKEALVDYRWKFQRLSAKKVKQGPKLATLGRVKSW